MKKLSALVLVLAIMLTAVALTACGGTELDLKSYTTVTFSGIDGEAKAKIDFDFAAFEEAYSTANGSSDPFSEKAMKNAAKLSSFENSLDYKASPEEGLSNGDEVIITFTYNEDYAKEAGLSLKNTSYKLTVGDLKEGTVVDAFDSSVFNTETGVRIEYEGIAPDGRLTISNKVDKKDPISQVSYSSDSNGTAYGDTITITASLPKSAEDDGYVLKEETYEYTLKDVDHYMTDTSELKAEDKKAIKEKYESIIKGNTKGQADSNKENASYPANITDIRIGDLYLFKTSDGYYSEDAYVSVYADITYTPLGKSEMSSNDCIAFYNISDFYIKSDGTLNFKTDYTKATAFFVEEERAEEHFWNKYRTKYNIEKISFE